MQRLAAEGALQGHWTLPTSSMQVLVTTLWSSPAAWGPAVCREDSGLGLLHVSCAKTRAFRLLLGLGVACYQLQLWEQQCQEHQAAANCSCWDLGQNAVSSLVAGPRTGRASGVTEGSQIKAEHKPRGVGLGLAICSRCICQSIGAEVGGRCSRGGHGSI